MTAHHHDATHRHGVLQHAVSAEAQAAAGAVWRAIRTDGLREGRWGWTELPPGLARLPDVIALSERVALLVGRETVEPQLLLRLPEEASALNLEQYEAHIDQPEPQVVIGVPLGSAGNVVQIEGEQVALAQGDMVWWPGDAVHAGTPNLGQEPRLLAYWRWAPAA